MTRTARSLEKLTDDLEELADAASGLLESFERWMAAEDASPYLLDRLRDRALRLRQQLNRLGLP